MGFQTFRLILAGNLKLTIVSSIILILTLYHTLSSLISLYLLNGIQKNHCFMQPEGSLPCSESHAIGLCHTSLQSDNFVSYFSVICLDVSPHLCIDLPCVSCLEGFRPKLFMFFSLKPCLLHVSLRCSFQM
jgi:hypothetical protein